MNLSKCILAIALVAAFSVGVGTDVAVARRRDRALTSLARFGPVLTLDQVIVRIQAVYPNIEVERVTLEQEQQVGLVYKVELNDERNVYVNAHTGEILSAE